MTARILIGCETSGVVRRAFAARGHDVWSCDLLPAEDRSNRHIICDVRDILDDGWDLLAVMHPPCTRLCNSGVRWLSEPPPGRTRDEMWAELDQGAALFAACLNAPIPRKAVENPVMHRHARERIHGLPRPHPSGSGTIPNGIPDLATRAMALPEEIRSVVLLGDHEKGKEHWTYATLLTGARRVRQSGREALIWMARHGGDFNNDALDLKGRAA